ncbi:MAG TPA: hypothetical protein VEL74_00040 [Thermoanaerobaculia bacterium]|nr:hypothetical protein [Thermoanaerobaculia bacterium]
MARHLDPTNLEELRRGRLSRGKSRDLVRHLLAGCEACLTLAARFLPAGPGAAGADSAPEARYSEVFDKVRQELAERQAALSVEQGEAPGILRELLQHPLDRQRLLIANSPRFRTWALCELLLEAAREEGFQDPAKALELARLGALTAEHLDASLYGDGRARDLAARAWATVGNAERIRSDFQAAEKSFQRAERLLKQGTGDPLEKAGVLLLKASLLGNQQRFPEAFRVLDRVVSIARKYGDLHLCGKAMVTRGFLCGVAHDLPEEEASRWLSDGLALVDPAAEPRLVVAARHNLILHLAECGRNAEALQLLEQTRPLYAFMGDKMNLLRLRWVEGRIAVAQGQFARAEPMLQEIRRELVEREIGYDAALVSLDLARIYARQGRSAEMRRLAEEMLPIFQSRQIQREALTALVIFQKAAEMESVTLGLVQELSEYLDRTRKHSGSRFSESV